MNELSELLSRLVAIDSVNPSLVPGGAGEGEIAAFVDGWARDAGLESTVLEGTPGRPSVLVRNGTRRRADAAAVRASRHGRRSARQLARAAHRGRPAVRARRLRHEGGRWRRRCSPAADGRGRRRGRGGGRRGALEPRRAGGAAGRAGRRGDRHRADAAAGRSSRTRASCGRRSRCAGAPRTARCPDQGVDAIAAAGPVLVRLAELDASLPSHPLLGRGSVHASLITGGTELATYPASCTLSLERRTLPGETVDGGAGGAARRRRRLVSRRRSSASRSRSTRRRRSSGWSARPRRGAEIAGAPYWTDAAFIAAAGIPTVLFGPGGDGAHADVEWVSLSDTRGGVRHAGRGRGAAVFVNPAYDPAAVPAPSRDALAFHLGLTGTRRRRCACCRRRSASRTSRTGSGCRRSRSSARRGRPSARCARPGVHTLVAASAGNHGRAVARVAAMRGLRCSRLPARALAPRPPRGDRLARAPRS